MAGSSGGRSLEETPTWAVAAVCFVLVLVSLFIEYSIHLLGKWLARKHRPALYEALEKIKSELMLMGFISLLLTVLQGPISQIYVPERIAHTMLPCPRKVNQSSDSPRGGSEGQTFGDSTSLHSRRLLVTGPSSADLRRVLASGRNGTGKDGNEMVSLVSKDGIHQLHIFIFVLAVFHVLYCITTMLLGRAKMRSWKAWEQESKTMVYQFEHDPERFRFARETSFGRRHLQFWSRIPVLMWMVCFFRQFFGSVRKVDYLTLRHGFVMAHLAPHSTNRFDFQRYIRRSLDKDFKVVVGISPMLWLFAFLLILLYTHGLYSYYWIPFLPLIIILLVGTKLQGVITKMGVEIQDKGDVVKGVPVVQPTDHHFWFSSPRLILFLIHFVLFQNAFQLAFFIWAWFQFPKRTCFHRKTADIGIRLSTGILTHVLCSYVTLPLYALVTQMGSKMKPTIFDENVAGALRRWHNAARKNLKEGRKPGYMTPAPSRPRTPRSSNPGTHKFSPVHLLHHYRSEMDPSEMLPVFCNEAQDAYDSASASHHTVTVGEGSCSHYHSHGGPDPHGLEMQEVVSTVVVMQPDTDKIFKEFSFQKHK